MSEREEARRLAHRVLERPNADPDDDLATLARQLLRAHEAELEARKEATIAWSACASVHREYAKGRDALFSTRQADFVRHEEAARAGFLSKLSKEGVLVDSRETWLILEVCVRAGTPRALQLREVCADMQRRGLPVYLSVSRRGTPFRAG